MARGEKPARKKTVRKVPAKGAAQARALAEAREQLRATSEILRVIARSPADVQPVLDALAQSAERLCETLDAAIFRVEGDGLRLVAHHGDIPSAQPVGALVPMSPGFANGRAVMDKRVIHVPDLQLAAEEFPGGSEQARRVGWRATLIVPLLRDDVVIGTIAVRRAEARPFSESQIALLQTFADQAVIAIENARLLTELQERNRDITEALEQQTATSEILRVISSSPTDVQPVFEAIVQGASGLLGGLDCIAVRFDGTLMHLVARHNPRPGTTDALAQLYPQPPTRAVSIGRVILDNTVVHISDVREDTAFDPRYAERIRLRGVLAVPMKRDDSVIGGISVSRATPGLFSERQVALLQTFADQAVIAVENVRLFTELEASNRELTTALDTQTATSDILRVISQAQTDVQPVFDAIIRSAVHLLHAYSGAVTRMIGDRIELAAFTSVGDAADEGVRALFPQPRESSGVHARAMRDRVPINIEDAQTDPRVPEAARTFAVLGGYRGWVAVPMLRHGEAVGAIAVTRREAGVFTADEVALLETFADQAVIAIENARLLNELQDKNASLSETLERQTATADVLRIIAQSPSELQPVLNAIAASAVRLCAASDVVIERLEGDRFYNAAHAGAQMKGLVGLPLPLTRAFPGGRAVLERRRIVLDDIHLVAETEYPDVLPLLDINTVHSAAEIPLLSEGKPLGTIAVLRAEVRPFTDAEIALLETFADQAVIAIENVRLFTELQTSNRELTTALDTQTATSDILRVISGSRTDVQPVFDAIVHSAVRLLRGYTGTLIRVGADRLELAALTTVDESSDAAVRALYPLALDSAGEPARAVRERTPINVSDAPDDPGIPERGRALARVRGYRSIVAVPLLRSDEALGSLVVTRREPGGFTGDEIALLQTFADQAVIAIENARLLRELHARTEDLTRSVGELRALGEIGQAIGSTLDLQTVLATIVTRATELAGADAGAIYEYDPQREVFEPRATEGLEDDIVRALVATPVRRGQGATGRLAEVREPIQLADVRAGEQLPVREAFIRAGYRALLAVPLVREDHLIGGLTVFRKSPGEFPANIVALLQTFATQSALAIQNARLFREIEIKSRELETASQHKSEFLASMSHELRTPLNAIIGFSDVLLQGMFGETNEKQTEYLRDILSSGQHLLSLINDILDLSKIEAGRMDLDVAGFDLPSAIDDALLLMRERAGRRGITLERQVDERLSEIRADQRKVKQVLLNLLSNAVKFTPERGRIDVRAGLSDGAAEISVTDTGIGIAPEDHEAVFEEFRQVGKAEKKAEGTGLGLALCRRFVELHGGRIWVKSQLGAGSTFTFTLPLPLQHQE